jgi:predicted enzyme related to lactoylglutathione lyase
MDSTSVSKPLSGNSDEEPLNLPPLQRDTGGNVDPDSIPDVIQWFLDFDQRVAIIKHPNVEQVFQWKQEQSRSAGENVFAFNRAEDRLAIGIIQALSENSTERTLHSWISQLLNALDAASKANESAAEAYKLDLAGGGSVIKEPRKFLRHGDVAISCSTVGLRHSAPRRQECWVGCTKNSTATPLLRNEDFVLRVSW